MSRRPRRCRSRSSARRCPPSRSTGTSESSASSRAADSCTKPRVGLPPRHDHLLTSVEVDAVRAMHVQVAVERALPAAEREECEGLSYRHVDAGHPGLDALPELTGGAA